MSEEEWSKLLDVADARKKRRRSNGKPGHYGGLLLDGVIHMVTAADGAAKGKGGRRPGDAVVRNESP